MASEYLKDDSYEKLIINGMKQQCFPLEDDVVSRLVLSCTQLQHLELTNMCELEEETRINVAGLLRNIIRNNPPLIHLDLFSFS